MVVERTAVGCAASGKSGGFLALDWCDGSALEPLARRSFALHAELAAEHGDRWGWRRLETLSVAASARRRLRGAGAGGPGWLAPEAVVHRRLGTAETTAQVNPAAFTQGLMEAAVARGAELRIGAVDGLARRAGRVTGALVGGEVVEGDAVVIALGPVVAARGGLAAAAADLRAQGPQRGVPQHAGHHAARAVRRVRGGRRHRGHARGVPAARRHDLRLRPLERGGPAARPGRGRDRRRRHGAARGDDPDLRAAASPRPRSSQPRPATARSRATACR